MISYKDAIALVKKEKPNRVVISCNELTDSWVFGFSYEDGTPSYDTPLRVYKNDGKSVKWNFMTKDNIEEFKEKFVRLDYL